MQESTLQIAPLRVESIDSVNKLGQKVKLEPTAKPEQKVKLESTVNKLESTTKIVQDCARALRRLKEGQLRALVQTFDDNPTASRCIDALAKRLDSESRRALAAAVLERLDRVWSTRLASVVSPVSRGDALVDAVELFAGVRTSAQTGKSASDFFFARRRLAIASGRHRTLASVYADRAWRYRMYVKCMLVRSNLALSPRGIRDAYIGLAGRVRQFPPLLARELILRAGATRILDPYAGWGDRLLGAMAAHAASGGRVEAYFGVDSNTSLRSAYRAMLDEYTELLPALPEPQRFAARLEFCAAEDLPVAKVEAFRPDCVLTCPPYYARETPKSRPTLVERYEGMPHYAGPDAFMRASELVLRRAWRVLPPGGRLVLVLNEFMAAAYCAALSGLPGSGHPERLTRELAAHGLGSKECVLVWTKGRPAPVP